MDVLFAVLGSVLFLPFGLVIAVLIKAESKGPVFFRQRRVGKGGRIFRVIKFRTMRAETEEAGVPFTDGQRMTKFGGILRKTSVDEVPQLFNILRGEMSFIGPRPLLLRYYPYYTPEENRRHDILPGVTGLAQVNGRNLLEWDERLAMDLQYVDGLSFAMDISIVIKSIQKIIKREAVVIRDENPILDLDEERSERKYRAI